MDSSARRILVIAGQELQTVARSPLFWGLVAFTAFATVAINPAAMIPSGDSAIGGVRPFSNSRYALAQTFALTGLLFYTFLTTLLAGLSVPRDVEARIGDLLHSTPLTAVEYVAGKFGGLLAGLGGVVSLHSCMALAWYEGASIWGTDAIQGPFRLLNYLIPALIFLVPGVVFCAAVAFAVGARSRGGLAVYLVPVGLFFVTLGGLIPRPPSAWEGAASVFFAVFDVWGASWLSHTIFHVDRGVEFYNHAPLAFDVPFLLNRLFVLSAPPVLLLLATRHVRGATRGTDAGIATSPDPVASPMQTRSAADDLTWRELGMTTTAKGVLAGGLEIARLDLRLARVDPGFALFVAFAMLLTLESLGSMRGVFDSQVLLTAGSAAVHLIEVITTMTCLLLLFHLVHSLDRSGGGRVCALTGAMPVPSASIVLGALLSAGVLVLVLLVTCALVVLALLALQDNPSLSVWPLVLVWGGLLTPTFILWTAAVSAVFAITRDRSATYVVSLVLLMTTVALLLSGSMTWVTNWTLWGALRWSDLSLFEMDRVALCLNRLSVTVVGALLLGLALAVWVRTESDGMRSDARRVQRRLWRAARLAPLGLLSVILQGDLARRIEAGPEGGAVRELDRAYWRRNVTAWSGVPPPVVSHVDVRIDLHPASSRMDVRGSFVVANASQHEIRRLPFTVGSGFQNVAWTLDRAPALAEDRAGLHVLTLTEPLRLGGSTDVGFVYSALVPHGITRNGGGASGFILPSGAVLHTLDRNFLPIPGFVEGVGVEERNRVEPAAIPEEAWKGELPPVEGSAVPFTTRMDVTSPLGYIVNGVGDKTHESMEDGRIRVVWESRHPVRFMNLVAGRFMEKRKEGAAVFHHKAHAVNADEILNALAAARARYSEWFRPYPWKELKLSEFADHASRAQSFPTNISFSEGIGFLAQRGEGLSLPTLITAHEAAHQWWGHLLTPGRAPGADVLLEGMAHFSTLLFLEAEHGAKARIDFARSLEERYADRRRVDAERPLVRIEGSSSATDETAVQDKGAWVIWMLQGHIGRQNMLAGLRSFIRRFEGSRDHPALPDLIEELRPYASSPVLFQEFVDQWFSSVVLPEFQFREAKVDRTKDGWRVLTIVENLGSGAVTLDVAAARGAPPNAAPTAEAVDYEEELVTVRLPPRVATSLSINTKFKPQRLVADPNVMVLQLNRTRAEVSLK